MNIASARFAEVITSLVLGSALLLASVPAAWCAEPPGAGAYARTDGRWIVDAQGRVLILHGINFGASAKGPPFLPWESEQDAWRLKRWGFDSVRYLTVWEAVEPQPGQYDDAYLDQVAQRLEWCRKAGLKVILDMHQDLYARKYGGDGAPEWACLDDGIPFAGPVPGSWFMTYLSPAVMRAFDNFWANKPGPGGVGIQDRFIAMWQHVARRFRDDTNIIGYDLLNEPFYGEAFSGIMNGIVMAAVQELGPEFAAKLATAMSNPDNLQPVLTEMLQTLMQRDALFKVLDAASPPAQEFERTHLQAFYNRIIGAVRQVDPHHICFFATATGDMSGTRLLTGLEAPRDAAGRPFPNVVLTPHYYDFSSDFNFTYAGTAELQRRFLARAAAAGDRMGVPTWFGEWGVWTDQANRPDGALLALHHMEALDQLLCGWAYWAHAPGFEKLSFLPVLTRPYAPVIAGVPSRMQTTQNRFELEFTPMPAGGETIIWVPPRYDVDTRVTFAGEGSARLRRDDEGFVHIICTPNAAPCTVGIALSPRR